MNKPEIGSKWRCVVDVPNCRVGQEVEIKKTDKDDDDDPAPLVFTDRGGFFLKRFSNGEFVRVGPLSPAPAEPAKAAGWKPKVGERVVASGKVTTEEDARGWVHVVWDGGGGQLVHTLSLRPEAAPGDTIPAPAPPTGAEILSESRQHRMRIADLEGDLAEEKAEKAALANQVTALKGDVALARRERDGWRAKWLRRDGR